MIKESQQLDIKNLISFRKVARHIEIQEHIERLIAYVESQGAKKAGCGISATYAANGDTMDIEMETHCRHWCRSYGRLNGRWWLRFVECWCRTGS